MELTNPHQTQELKGFKHKCGTEIKHVSIEDFVNTYIKYDALCQITRSPTADQTAAYSSMSMQLAVPMCILHRWSSKFRVYWYYRMLRLAMKSDKPDELLALEPQWVQDAEAKLKMLPRACEEMALNRRDESSKKVELTPDRMLQLIVTYSKRYRSLCSTALYLDIKRTLRLNCALKEIHSIWVNAQGVAMRVVTSHIRCGDIATSDNPISETSWRVADLVLQYTDVDTQRLITDESLILYEELETLNTLFNLVIKYGAECSHTQERRAKLWTQIYKDYTAGGRVTTILILQRRWHELKLQVRARFSTYARSEHQSAAPDAIHIDIAKKLPVVLTSPMASWSWQVARNLIVTQLYDNTPADKKTPEAKGHKKWVPDDDVLLIENKIDTVHVESDTDTEDRIANIESTSKQKCNASTDTSDDRFGHQIGITMSKESGYCKTKLPHEDNSNDVNSNVPADVNIKTVEITNTLSRTSTEAVERYMSILRMTKKTITDDVIAQKFRDNPVLPEENADTGQAIDKLKSLDPKKVQAQIIFESESDKSDDDEDDNNSNILDSEQNKSLHTENQSVNRSIEKGGLLMDLLKHREINYSNYWDRLKENEIDENVHSDGSTGNLKNEIATNNDNMDMVDADENSTQSVDPKLIMNTAINLVRVHDTLSWKKHAITQKYIKMDKLNLKQLQTVQDRAKNIKEEREHLVESTVQSGRDREVSDASTSSRRATYVRSSKSIRNSRSAKRAYSSSSVSDESSSDEYTPWSESGRPKKRCPWRLKLWDTDHTMSDSQKQKNSKRVELRDIDEVRRSNQRLLTAEVAPINAKRVRRNSDTRKNGDRNMARDLQEPPPSALDPNRMSVFDLNTLLGKLFMEQLQRKWKHQINPEEYCCLARRHRIVNDARKRISLSFPDINIHVHADNVCKCCCANLMNKESRKKQLESELNNLQEELRGVLRKSYYKPLQVSPKEIKKIGSFVCLSKVNEESSKVNEESTNVNEESSKVNEESSKEEENPPKESKNSGNEDSDKSASDAQKENRTRRKEAKTMRRKLNKIDKNNPDQEENKEDNRTQLDGLDEWERQKKAHEQYFKLNLNQYKAKHTTGENVRGQGNNSRVPNSAKNREAEGTAVEIVEPAKTTEKDKDNEIIIIEDESSNAVAYLELEMKKIETVAPSETADVCARIDITYQEGSKPANIVPEMVLDASNDSNPLKSGRKNVLLYPKYKKREMKFKCVTTPYSNVSTKPVLKSTTDNLATTKTLGENMIELTKINHANYLCVKNVSQSNSYAKKIVNLSLVKENQTSVNQSKDHITLDDLKKNIPTEKFEVIADAHFKASASKNSLGYNKFITTNIQTSAKGRDETENHQEDQRDKDLFLYRRKAPKITLEKLFSVCAPSVPVLLRTDGARNAVLLREDYLILTESHIPCKIPTFWTMAPYQNVARVIIEENKKCRDIMEKALGADVPLDKYESNRDPTETEIVEIFDDELEKEINKEIKFVAIEKEKIDADKSNNLNDETSTNAKDLRPTNDEHVRQGQDFASFIKISNVVGGINNITTLPTTQTESMKDFQNRAELQTPKTMPVQVELCSSLPTAISQSMASEISTSSKNMSQASNSSRNEVTTENRVAELSNSANKTMDDESRNTQAKVENSQVLSNSKMVEKKRDVNIKPFDSSSGNNEEDDADRLIIDEQMVENLSVDDHDSPYHVSSECTECRNSDLKVSIKNELCTEVHNSIDDDVRMVSRNPAIECETAFAERTNLTEVKGIKSTENDIKNDICNDTEDKGIKSTENDIKNSICNDKTIPEACYQGVTVGSDKTLQLDDMISFEANKATEISNDVQLCSKRPEIRTSTGNDSGKKINKMTAECKKNDSVDATSAEDVDILGIHKENNGGSIKILTAFSDITECMRMATSAAGLYLFKRDTGAITPLVRVCRGGTCGLAAAAPRETLLRLTRLLNMNKASTPASETVAAEQVVIDITDD